LTAVATRRIIPPIEPPPPPPQPVRTLPGRPALDREEGVKAGLVTRIVLTATVVFGQMWALVVGLDRYLLGYDGQAWALFGFSALSFLVVLALVFVHPAPRRDHTTGQARTQTGGLYAPVTNKRHDG
jgi:hypothetical protein